MKGPCPLMVQPLSPGPMKEAVDREGTPLFPVHLPALGSSFKGRELDLKSVRKTKHLACHVFTLNPKSGAWHSAVAVGVRGRMGGGVGRSLGQMGRKGFQCRQVSQPEARALGPVTSRGCCALERARPVPGPVLDDVGGTQVCAHGRPEAKTRCSGVGAGAGTETQCHTLGTGRRHLFSTVGLSTASGKESQVLGWRVGRP